MSNDAANQWLMFGAEALTIALLLLGLFRMRSRLGLSPLYVTLGVFQPIQVLLASSIYVEILPGLVISPGSVIMFTASLFAILLVYIREDAVEARKVIYGIMVANLAMSLLLLVFGVHIGFPGTLNFLGLPREIFGQGARVLVAGTLALLADVLLIIFVYEAVRRFIPRVPFLRIYLTMAIILIFDTLVFATGAFYGQANYRSIVVAGIVGKVGLAAFFAAALTLFLRFVEPADRASSEAELPFRDIFYALTYREKYEIERARAERAVRESEARYRELAESIADPFFAMDSDLRFTYWNQAAEELTGIGAADAVGQTFYKVFPEARGTMAEQLCLETLKTERPQRAVQEARLAGRHCVFEISTCPIRRGLAVFVRDISERERAENEIRRRARELATLLEVSQALAATLDLEAVLQTSINGAVGLMGLGSGAIYLLEGDTLCLGATTPPLPPQFPEESRRASLADHPRIRQAITTGLPVILPDTAAADLTAAERAVSELRGLRTLLYVPLLGAERVLGVFILGSVGDPRPFSDAEIDLSRTLSVQAALAVENAHLYEQVKEHVATLEQRVAERTAELKNRVTEVEKLNRAMGNLLEDLRASHHEVEETAQRLQRANAELETFTYSVSHDLKAPLRGIDGYSRLLLEEYVGQIDENGQAFLYTIRQAAGHMNQLIDDLLAYSRLERRAVRTTSLDPRALVEALVAEQAEEIHWRAVSLTVEIPCQAVTAEAEGLAQALRNLLDNALKFTRDVPEPRIEVGGRKVKEGCILWVRDNGVGFEMQYHDRIFDIFQRLHRSEEYPGTGIGLAIVRKAMQRMGGRVWAESVPGEGATFFLELPGGPLHTPKGGNDDQDDPTHPAGGRQPTGRGSHITRL